MYWIGYDIGSSSVKAALISAEDGAQITVVQSPESEMEIAAPQPGWGEQDPELWWEHLCRATTKLLSKSGIASKAIKGIGISYQMHGLVMVDKSHRVLRPSIIWCDSRAVASGERLQEISGARTVEDLLNKPGNFTLSKLYWVKENEPDTYKNCHKIMLPGDYIAMRFSGDITTTASGLSEGIIWDFKAGKPASWLLDAAGIDSGLIPDLVTTFGIQAKVSPKGSKETGLDAGIPIMYRAGDQPNNAMSLNVLHPGEVAATGGTSGVVYAVSDQLTTQEPSRINNFAHVNYTVDQPRIGKLLCINGTGILYNWLRKISGQDSYPDMNKLAEATPIGADGVQILPFGNGAERMLENKNPGAQITGLDFNRHGQGHLFRAALEGIAFSFVYGMNILREDGVELKKIRAGNDNLFRAKVFSQTIASLTNTEIEIVETTGAVGAARGAAVAFGDFDSFDQATATDEVQGKFLPEAPKELYQHAYNQWLDCLNKQIK